MPSSRFLAVTATFIVLLVALAWASARPESGAAQAAAGGPVAAQAAAGEPVAPGAVQAQSATLTVSNVTGTTATLTISGHGGVKWYYRAGPGNKGGSSCPVAQAGTTSVQVSGLIGGTLYNFKAYSTESNCAAGTPALAAAGTFTTPWLAVVDPTPTTATLKLFRNDGPTGDWYYEISRTGQQGDCQGPVSGDTVSLTGLTPGIGQFYQAYSDRNCTSSNLISYRLFYTPSGLPECHGLSASISRGQTGGEVDFTVTNHTPDPIYNLEISVNGIHWFIKTNAYTQDILRQRRTPPDRYYLEVINPYSERTYFRQEIAGGLYWTVEVKVFLWLKDSDGAKVCETVATSLQSGTETDYSVATGVENPAPPAAGEKATFVATVHVAPRATAIDAHADVLSQTCVNLRFEGLEPDHAGVVFYDGPNGKYNEDGTLSDLSNDARRPRSSRLEYDHDGIDEDFGVAGRRPQCSDAAGRFEGSLFRIGRTVPFDFADHRKSHQSGDRLFYVVKVPATPTGDGPHCMTATVRALPVEPARTGVLIPISERVSAVEMARDNTDRVCLGAPKASDGLTMFSGGRADLLTLRQCADGASFPCVGKSANDLVQYVNGANDAPDRTGNASRNAGSPYDVFHPEDVVVNVPDLIINRLARKNPASPNYPANRPAWYTGNPTAHDNYFPVIQGVHLNYALLGAAHSPYYTSICPKASQTYLDSATATTGMCDAMATDTNPGAMRALQADNWTNIPFDIKKTQPSDNFTDSSRASGPNGLVFEFSALGTYEADIIIEGRPASGTKKSAGRYKFHVGPAADLSVSSGGASRGVATGKTAFTILAGIDATADIGTVIEDAHGHGEHETVHYETLAPTVTITDGDGNPISANDISEVAPNLGTYDKTTGVWSLAEYESDGGESHWHIPEGFVKDGRATLTLVVDSAAVSSVKASIANSVEVCENAAGAAQNAVDGRAAIDRATCEFNQDGTTSNHHWGSYQKCIDSAAEEVTLTTSGKTACTTEDSTNTWHTTEVYDWRPHNNEMTIAASEVKDAFELNARGAGRTSIHLRWAEQAGVDDYVIYGWPYDPAEPRIGLNPLYAVATVSADTTEYYHDYLSPGGSRYYVIRARQDGAPGAMSVLAQARADTALPLAPWGAGAAKPAAIGTASALRFATTPARIQVWWDQAANAESYEVQYRDVTTDASAAWQAAATDVANLNYLHTGAESGKRYEFRVRGMTTVGSEPLPGDWTATNVVPKAGEAPPPGSVGDVMANKTGATLAVDWPHAPHATHYTVQVQAAGSGTCDTKLDNTALTSNLLTVDPMTYRVSTTITGLDTNKSYYVRVRGANYTVDATPALREGAWTQDGGTWSSCGAGQAGASAASGAAAATQLPAAPGAVGSVSVTHNGGSLSVSWPAAAGAAGYQVAYTGDNGANWTTAADSHGSTSITISGVDSEATYVARVRAYNDGGAGNWTDSAPANPPQGGGDDDDDDDG